MDSSSTYDLLEVIARGDNATVYRARDEALKRNVAIKELNERFRQDSRRLAQYCEEAQFFARLEHDNLVRVYGVDARRGWMIMELMRGDLAAKAAEGPLSPDLVRSIVRQALEALKFLHEQGRVHGQIRPGKLLYNDLGRIKLGDFAGTMAGKKFRRPTSGHKYAAPEWLKPEFGLVRPTADLYALGFVALELLCGRRFESLFKGVSVGAADADQAWLRLHTSAAERVPPAAELVPGLPEDLAGVIDRMLEKEVSARCPSASEALRLLEEKPLALIDVAKTAPSAATTELAAPTSPAKAAGAANSAARSTPPRPSKSPAAKFGAKWRREQLDKPWVVYPLCGLTVIATAYFLFFSDSEDHRRVMLNVDPPGAEVLIDDRPVEAEPTLSLGMHRVSASRAGYQKLEKRIVVEPGEGAQQVSLELDRQPSDTRRAEKPAAKRRKIAIDLAPPEAQLFIDDGREPVDAVAELELPLGEHRFRAALPGYRSCERNVTIEQGEEPQRIELALSREPVAAVPSRLPDDLAPAPDSATGFAGLPERAFSKKLKAAGAPLEFALIPPGEFAFGSPDGDRWPGELPQEKVAIEEPFYISVVETTNRHFDAFAKANPSQDAGAAWRTLFDAQPEEAADWPVVLVSWEQAAAFCRWLQGELPSERQWERAARGAEGRRYPWGDRDLDPQHANLRFASLGQLLPVSALADGATPGGLRHLLGNAAEWCRDAYEPGAGDDGGTPGVAERWHAIRGGSYKDPPAAARAAMRANCAPEGANDVGFRVTVPVRAAAPRSSADREFGQAFDEELP